MKICSRNQNHAVLAAMALLAGAAACSGQNKAATPSSGTETAVQFALSRSVCRPAARSWTERSSTCGVIPSSTSVSGSARPGSRLT